MHPIRHCWICVQNWRVSLKVKKNGCMGSCVTLYGLCLCGPVLHCVACVCVGGSCVTLCGLCVYMGSWVTLHGLCGWCPVLHCMVFVYVGVLCYIVCVCGAVLHCVTCGCVGVVVLCYIVWLVCVVSCVTLCGLCVGGGSSVILCGSYVWSSVLRCVACMCAWFCVMLCGLCVRYCVTLCGLCVLLRHCPPLLHGSSSCCLRRKEDFSFSREEMGCY